MGSLPLFALLLEPPPITIPPATLIGPLIFPGRLIGVLLFAARFLNKRQSRTSVTVARRCKHARELDSSGKLRCLDSAGLRASITQRHLPGTAGLRFRF
jgi:hypothetical protein